MKKINPILISLLLFFIYSCNTTNEPECSTQMNIDKFEGIIFTDGVETKSFNNYDDLILYLEKSNKLNGDNKSRFETFQNVISNIEKINQDNLTQDSVELNSCISKLYDKNTVYNDSNMTLKSGVIANIYYTEESFRGDFYVMGIPIPVLPTQFRNSISSVQALSPAVLCSKKWFLGKHLVLWGSEMSLYEYGFDNLTNSFFML